jgi:hypothetical protein
MLRRCFFAVVPAFSLAIRSWPRSVSMTETDAACSSIHVLMRLAVALPLRVASHSM